MSTHTSEMRFVALALGAACLMAGLPCLAAETPVVAACPASEKASEWIQTLKAYEASAKPAPEGRRRRAEELPGPVMAAYGKALAALTARPDRKGQFPAETETVRDALDKELAAVGGEVLCGPQSPVTLATPLRLLLVRRQAQCAQTLPMDRLVAAKSAEQWPGAVPATAGRVTETITLQPTVSGWVSTGPYAAPGAKIEVETSDASGTVQATIGCHRDHLGPQLRVLGEDGKPSKDVALDWDKVAKGEQRVTDSRSLRRWPLMTRTFTLTEPKQTIGHVMGGVLWLRLDKSDRPVRVTLSGAVRMPWFRLGVDTEETWQKRLAESSAPWGELQTRNVVFTVETRYLRDVKDIVRLAQWWQDTVDEELRFAGRGKEVGQALKQPFRVVDDTQISAGSGHSGYPVMCQSWGRGQMDLDRLLKDGTHWGTTHEIGHNLGQGPGRIFALPGNGEAICNFYGVCATHRMAKTPYNQIRVNAWKNLERLMKEPSDQTLWARTGHFEHLTFYTALAHHFGADSALAVVNSDTPAWEGDQTGDRLCRAWSKAAQRDLTPYFTLWGFVPSQKTQDYTKQWKPWPSEAEKATLFSTEP